MGDKVTLYLDSEQSESLKTVKKEHGCDNRSEAGRLVLKQGFAELGINNGHDVNPETRLRRVIRELGRLFAYSAVGYAGIAVLLPVTLVFQWALLLALLGIGCIALEQFLKDYEPGVSRQLFGWFNTPGGKST